MAVDMFLKLDGIPGESKDHKHKETIDIDSFSWGMNNTATQGSGGGGGAGKVSVHDISISKKLDKASCLLMAHNANGKHIPSGLITVRKAGEKPLEYLKIKLTDILVSGYQVAGSEGSERLSEQITLNFAKVNVEYQEQLDSGGGKAGGAFGWDVKGNIKV